MNFKEFHEYEDRFLNTSSILNKKIDVSYSKNSECVLDIYYPNESKEKYPVIIFFHGGAFIKGDKKKYQLQSALQGVLNGYAVISVNYRLIPEYHYLEYIQDAWDSVAFISKNAKSLKLDTDNLFLWGESAGGFLALLVSLMSINGGVNKFIDSNSKNDYLEINGVISWYTVTNLVTHPDMIVGNTTLNNLKYREVGEELKKILVKLSPINLIKEGCPNMYIQHGLKDDVVSPIQSLEFAQKASEVLTEKQLKIDFLVEANHTTDKFCNVENLEKIYLALDAWKK